MKLMRRKDGKEREGKKNGGMEDIQKRWKMMKEITVNS